MVYLHSGLHGFTAAAAWYEPTRNNEKVCATIQKYAPNGHKPRFAWSILGKPVATHSQKQEKQSWTKPVG